MRKTRIIDRSLPEIIKNKEDIDINKLGDYCALLNDLGVSILEIDCNTIKKFRKLPEHFCCAMRLNNADDLHILLESGIGHCLISDEALIDEDIVSMLHKKSISVEFEVKCNNAEVLINKLRKRKLYNIDIIRILGLSSILGYEWVDTVSAFQREVACSIDICPEDKYYSAVAAGLEAYDAGFEYVTGSFGGFGGRHGYSPIELIIAGVMIKNEIKSDYKLSILPQISKIYSELSGIEITGDKPLIGKNIFKHESGIHVAAMLKNDSAYEAFMPELVGQSREFVVGKHSGRNSLINKLEEKGIEWDPSNISELLKKIKSKSAALKRSLYDDEIKELVIN